MTRISTSDLIFNLLSKGKKFNLENIRDQVRRKKGTISSALSRGVKKGTFTRISRGVYAVGELWYHKFISAIQYCEGDTAHHDKKKQVFAFTYEPDQTSREADIAREIRKKQPRCFMLDDFEYGYGQERVRASRVDERAIYPEIVIEIDGRVI